MNEVTVKFNEQTTVELDGGLELRIGIYPDDCDCNPRREFDHLGIMVCWHRHYDLGDVESPPEPDVWKTELAAELDPTVDDRIDYWSEGDGWTALWNAAQKEWLRLSCEEGKARTEIEESKAAKLGAIMALEQAKARYTLEPTDLHKAEVDRLAEYQAEKHKAVVDAEYRADELRRAAWAARQKAYDTSEARINALVDQVLERETVMLPLYLYDHSGITMRTTAFSCPWDSGQVGVIYVTRADLLEEYGLKRLSAKARKRAIALLRAEVEEYDQYLTGAVYGFDWKINQIIKCDQCGRDERIYVDSDSCWGFFGDPKDYMIPDHVQPGLDKYNVTIIYEPY